MEFSVYFLFNLGYVLIFTLLGLFALTLHTPKDAEFKNYRTSRRILGWAFVFMAIYCVVRVLLPEHHGTYFDFWARVFSSLVFTWMNYTAFLYLVSSDYKLRNHFIVDGVMPASLLLIAGVLGMLVPSIRHIVEIAFGVIFICKNSYMFYICDREWRRVNKRLLETYDASPNITWMRVLIWLTYLLSLCALGAFYSLNVTLVQSIIAPIMFVYMLLKIVNYLPKKIDEMRCQESLEQEVATTTESGERAKDLAEKMEPLIAAWVAAKRFTTPNLSIKDVAQQMGTNHSYLSAYLNNYLNSSFQVWLNTLRIEESKRILETESIPIEDVGIKVGIPQSYNYSRWFKQVTETTPFKYRKQINRDRGL